MRKKQVRLKKDHMSKIDREKLCKYCEENPFAMHTEAAVYFGCSESGIRCKKSLGYHAKKNKNTIKNEMSKKEQSL